MSERECPVNRLGVASHVSGSRKLILRTKIKVRTGMQVYDEELKSVGKIVDVFGPVKNPYVSIAPVVDGLERYVGRSLYVLERDERRGS